ncbi:MAG TPA: hypothetical protein VGD34_15215 [Kribbella sp.]
MESGAEWIAGGLSYAVTVFSEVSSRDGLGWELVDRAPTHDPTRGPGPVMEVFREDSAAVPVISCKTFRRLPADLVARFTHEATADLLAGVLHAESTGWLAANIARALALTGRNVLGWTGVEEPVELADELTGTQFAGPGAERVPFAWLRARLDEGEAGISIYQDDAHFGIRFEPRCPFTLEAFSKGEFRLHPEAPLPVGFIHATEVVIDSSVRTTGAGEEAVLTEVTLHIGDESVLLIAAGAYGPDEWHIYDESLVVLRDAAAADRLEWFPQRPNGVCHL